MLGSGRTLFLVSTAISAAAILTLSGCNNSTNTITEPLPKPTAVIFVSPPPKSLAVKASATLTASAIYASVSQSGSTLVTWTVTCGSSSCGTFGPNADATATTYTAPSAIPTGGSVTVTATSVADASKTVSATITIVAPIPIVVAFFAPPPAVSQIKASFPLSASVTNDVSANPQINWAVTCQATDCGSFNPATTYNESPTTYSAPANIPPGASFSVTVKASSVTDPTKSASANILIRPAAATLADGTYVFQLSGPAGSGASFTTGAFVAKAGVIVSGQEDQAVYTRDADNNINASTTHQAITGGSYATTPDGNLQLSLQLGPGAIATITGTLAASGKGFVSSLNGVPSSGSLDLQTSTAAPFGGYAVSLFGGDQFSSPALFGGIVNIDSPGNISGAGSILDVQDGQFGYTGEHSLVASTVTAPDGMGRFEFQINPAASTGPNTPNLPPVYVAGYIIDATRIRLIETGDSRDTSNFQGVLGGTALGQGANTGKFTAASVANASYVFGAQGNDTQGQLQIAGVFSFNANSLISGQLNWNDVTASVPQNPASFGGHFSVDPTGRVTLSDISDGTFHYAMYAYLTGDGNALLLSNDINDTFTGQAFQQQAGAFSSTSLSGNYGLNATSILTNGQNGGMTTAFVTASLTAANSGGSNIFAGFADNANGAANFAIDGAFTPNADSVYEGMLAGFDPADRTNSGNFVLYLVDGSKAVLIQTDTSQSTLGVIQLTQ